MVEHSSVQTGFADINGGKLYYEVAGHGPAMVFAHAGVADRRMWDDQFLVFAQSYQVIRFDFWGFGNSTIESDTFFLHEDLYQLLKFLGIKQAHLIGCSLGGRVIIDLALAHPAMISSLVVVGSGLSGYRFEGEARMRFVEQIIAARKLKNDAKEIELKLQFWVAGQGRNLDQVTPHVRERARQMLTGKPGGQGEGQQLEPSAIGRLSEISVPTLIIIGDRDDMNILTIGDLLVSNIAGAQKIIMPNTAHLPNMEKPEEFNEVVLKFLRSMQP